MLTTKQEKMLEQVWESRKELYLKDIGKIIDAGTTKKDHPTMPKGTLCCRGSFLKKKIREILNGK